MNETDVVLDVNMNKICRACLRSDVDLYPMSFELKNWYESFVDKSANQNYDMMLCTICKWIFVKVLKFIHQCKIANDILNGAILAESKPKQIHSLHCHNFISEVILQTIPSESNIKSEDSTNIIITNKIDSESHNFKNNIKSDSQKNYCQFIADNSFENTERFKLVSHSKTNSTQVYATVFENRQQQKLKTHNQDTIDSEQLKSESLETDFENTQQKFQSKSYDQDSRYFKLDSEENSTQQYDTCLENSDEQYIFNEALKIENSGDEFQNDDDVPLMVLKSDEKKKKKRKQKIKNQSAERDSKPKKKCKKGTKQLKEGFSSRMVQETKEYIVIKLNREQVLNEMEQRSKSEEYLRYPYKCEKCVKGFNFDDVLYTHMEKHVADNGSFQCDMCHQYCPNAVSLRGHIKSHTTRYKCKLCGQVRLARQHLLEHYTNTHANQPVTYNCETCHFTTNKRTVMQRHVRSHNKTSLLACHKCGKLYKNMETLRVHTTIHDKSRLQCKLCNATFVYQALLKKHELSVHQRRDFYCVECDIEFKTKISLNLHFKRSKRHRDASITTNNRPQQPVECSICQRTYSNRDTLRAHVYRAHRDKSHKPKTENYENKIEV